MRWKTPPRLVASVTPNKKSEIGQLKWCASQCRINILNVKTSTTPFQLCKHKTIFSNKKIYF